MREENRGRGWGDEGRLWGTGDERGGGDREKAAVPRRSQIFILTILIVVS